MTPMPPHNVFKVQRGYDRSRALNPNPIDYIVPVATRPPSKAFLIASSILKAPTTVSSDEGDLTRTHSAATPLAKHSDVVPPRVPRPCKDKPSTLVARLQLAKQCSIAPPSDASPMSILGLQPSSHHESPLRRAPACVADTESPRLVNSIAVSHDRPTSSLAQRILQVNENFKALQGPSFTKHASSTGNITTESTASPVRDIDEIISSFHSQTHVSASLLSVQSSAHSTPVLVSSHTLPVQNLASATTLTPVPVLAPSPDSPSHVTKATHARHPSRPLSRTNPRPPSPHRQPPAQPHTQPRAQSRARPTSPPTHHSLPLQSRSGLRLSRSAHIPQTTSRQPQQRPRPSQERMHQPRSRAPQRQSGLSQRPLLHMSRGSPSSPRARSAHHGKGFLEHPPLPASVSDTPVLRSPSPTPPSSTAPSISPLPLQPLSDNPPLPVAVASPPACSSSRPHPTPLSPATLMRLAAIIAPLLPPVPAAWFTPTSLPSSPAPVSNAIANSNTPMSDLVALPLALAPANTHTFRALPSTSPNSPPRAHSPCVMRTIHASCAAHSLPLRGTSPMVPSAMGSPPAGAHVPPHVVACAARQREHSLYPRAHATHADAIGLPSRVCSPGPDACVSQVYPAVSSAQPRGCGDQCGCAATPHSLSSECARPVSPTSVAAPASYTAPTSPVMRDGASASVVVAPLSDANAGECSCVSDVEREEERVREAYGCNTDCLRRKNEEYMRENEELRRRLTRAESEVCEYTSLLEAARAGLAGAEKEYSALHDHYTATQTRHATDHDRYAATEARYIAERGLRETLEKEVCELQQQEMLVAENARLKEDNQVCTSMVERLQKERNVLLATNADLETRNSHLMCEKEEVKVLQRRNEEADARTVDLKREMMALILAHQQIKAKLAAIVEKNAAAETVIRQLREQAARLQDGHEVEVNRLKGAVGEALDDKEKERVRVQELQTRCEWHITSERALQTDIAAKTATIAKLSELLRRQKEKLSLLRSMEAQIRTEKDVVVHEAPLLQEHVKETHNGSPALREEVHRVISHEVARVSSLYEQVVRTDTMTAHRLAENVDREAALQRQVDVLLAREVSLCEAVRELVQQGKKREQQWRERESALRALLEQSLVQHADVEFSSSIQ